MSNDDTCYFCGAASADPALAVRVTPSRSVNVDTREVGVEPVHVPRCAACRRVHRRRQSLGAVTLTLVVLGWIFAMPLVLLGDAGVGIYLGVCIGLTVANILFWRWRDAKGSRRGVYHAEKHPALDEWRAQGYSFEVERR